MSEQRFATAAVVLGMHRSGTSALAGVLALSGFSAPKTLLPTSAVNERGFWESEPIKALNDELLGEFGIAWHGIDALPFEHWSNERLQSVDTRIRAVLEKEFDEGSRPIIKDPRLCRVLPLWQAAIRDLTTRSVNVITLRSPLEVAQSLAVRNEFDADLSYLLWARHYLDAEFHTRTLHRAVVSYDRLVDDWRQTLATLSTALNIDLTCDGAAEQSINEYLSSGLRHHRPCDKRLRFELERLPLVEETYRILRDWADHPSVDEPDLASLDRIRQEFDAISGTVSRVVEHARLDRKRLATARSQVEDASAELTRARKSAEDLDGLRKSQAHLEERIESAVTSLSNAIQERTEVERKLAETQREGAQERANLQKLLADAHAERSSLDQQLAATIDRMRKERADLELKIVAAERASASLMEEIDGLQKEHLLILGKLQSHSAAIESELKDVKRKYRSTQHQLTRDHERLRRAQEQLLATQADLARVQQSVLWRSYTQILSSLGLAKGSVRRLFGGDRKRRAQELIALRDSNLFDGNWYLNRYPDVRAAGIDPAVHFAQSGWREGRDPSPLFSTSRYLKSNSDVARAGINPLLHFVEFGYAEGRSILELPRPATIASTAPDEEFGPAAPCASFPVPQRAPIRWRRAARLREFGEPIIIRGQAIGFAADTAGKSYLVAAFERLAALSGCEANTVGSGADPKRSGQNHLRDAWYVGKNRLRSRWQNDGMVVVRVYQHDPAKGNELALVGEALVVSDVDFVDVNLANAYFPLLFVILDTEGVIRNVELLAFPSLCRGGIHYPELLAAQNSAEALAILATATNLHERLLGIIGGSSEAFAGKLAVDLTGADGSEACFQPDFHAWLSNVMRIGIEPRNDDTSGPSKLYLGAAIAMPAAPQRRSGETIILPADTVPSIELLTTPASAMTAADYLAAMPLAIATGDPAQPATLIHLPTRTPALENKIEGFPPVWVRTLRTEPGKKLAPTEDIRIAAIRRRTKPLPSDSELLIPVASSALQPGEKDRPITWLLFPEDWGEEEFEQGLQALALQDVRNPLAVALVGEVQASASRAASRMFGDRVSLFEDVAMALESVATPLVGYLGAHVILHNGRTSRLLAAMLDDAAVVSASCVLVSVERRGKGWHVAVADAGSLSSFDGVSDPRPDDCHTAQLIWRTTYPTLRPPRNLWVSKTSTVRGWLERAGPLKSDEGIQACTSLVTASYLRTCEGGIVHLRPPASAETCSIRSEALFG
jgi:hypothetical protein